MWMRMVHKYPAYSLDSLPRATGKSWDEWDRILATGLQQRCGILPVIDYLVREHRLNPAWAKVIAMEYVLGSGSAERLN